MVIPHSYFLYLRLISRTYNFSFLSKFMLFASVENIIFKISTQKLEQVNIVKENPRISNLNLFENFKKPIAFSKFAS